MIVKPGEKIPTDGNVVEGKSSVDEKNRGTSSWVGSK